VREEARKKRADPRDEERESRRLSKVKKIRGTRVVEGVWTWTGVLVVDFTPPKKEQRLNWLR